MKGVEGKVAIITGSASGIGVGLVSAFIAAGVKVVAADIQEKEGRAAAAALGDACIFQPTDLRQDAQIDRLVAAAADRFGGIDFLVNCACTYVDEGGGSPRAMWLDGLDVNLVGHVMLLRAALPYLRQSPCASVVNFTSESAHVGLPGRWVYPTSKAAIEQVTRAEAIDLAVDGIRVNAVMPGWTWSAKVDQAPPELQHRVREWTSRFHMLGRAGRPEEVADVVLFLCSAHARFITGSVMKVDGGHSALGPQGREVVLPSRLMDEIRAHAATST